MLDYFEMERVIEELAKAYPAQCATTWFKVTKNHKPSKEEYRNKVVEYMRQFEYLLATFPQGPETDKLKDLVKKSLAREIEKVLEGNNNEVERRHKHYVINSPTDDPKHTFKEVSEQQYSEKSTAEAAITAEVLIKEKKSKKIKTILHQEKKKKKVWKFDMRTTASSLS